MVVAELINGVLGLEAAGVSLGNAADFGLVVAIAYGAVFLGKVALERLQKK